VVPTQADNEPVIVGFGLMVKIAVATQPKLLVKVMVLLPALTPFTTPMAVTVATAKLEEAHGFVKAAVPEPDRLVVPPTQAASVPLIIGFAFIVTVAVTVQPFELV
jgi:hypothetical protein